MKKQDLVSKSENPLAPSVSSTEPPPKAPRRGRHANSSLDQRIMETVIEIVATEGDSRCTMDEIARRTGVPKSTIYRRWPSKGVLLIQSYLSILRRFRKKIDTGSVQSDMEASIAGDIAAIRDPRLGRMAINILMEAQMSSEMAALMREKTLLPLRQARKEMLQRGISRGEISPDSNLEIAMDMQFGAVWYRILSNSAPLDEGLAKRMSAQICKSLRSRREST